VVVRAGQRTGRLSGEPLANCDRDPARRLSAAG
jgi:hypothetical protein